MVIKSEPKTCNAAPLRAMTKRPCCNRATISAEKVERVVNELRKPVIANRCHSGATAGKNAKKHMSRPMQYPPIRFAARVPMGMGGKIEFKARPISQRDVAPREAPAQMDRMELNVMEHRIL